MRFAVAWSRGSEPCWRAGFRWCLLATAMSAVAAGRALLGPRASRPPASERAGRPRSQEARTLRVSKSNRVAPVSYRDLREFIGEVDALGALRRIAGADPHHEIGAITEVAAGMADCPALLFDPIKGYPPGLRIVSNVVTSPQRAALALGIDPLLRPLDALKAWMARRQHLAPCKPVEVANPPFMENSRRGNDVDLAKFPAPVWHKQDGGAYIGSGSLVVMRDPDGGWINASIYRVQVHGPSCVTIQFDHA